MNGIDSAIFFGSLFIALSLYNCARCFERAARFYVERRWPKLPEEE